jgi:uncharacterized protein
MDGFEFAALVTGVLLLAGFVKGVVGLGLPTVSMGLLSLTLLPGQAAALLTVPNLVTNVWQLWDGPDFRALLKRLAPMLATICIGVWLGNGWLVGEGALQARVALGLAIVAYAGLALADIRVPSPGRFEPIAGPLVGLATGLVTAATGVVVMPSVPYLQSLKLDKEDLIQALGLTFLVAMTALTASLATSDVYDLATLALSSFAVLPALAGMHIGTKLRRRLGGETFRRIFLIGLLALGAYLAVRGLA